MQAKSNYFPGVMFVCQTHRRQRPQAGFTITSLAVIVALFGLVMIPLLRLAASSIERTGEQETQAALSTARDALVAFAAANQGCLPFAADFEGGYADTDGTGTSAGYRDTGDRPAGTQYSGDLPWAELGLTNSLLDGDGLRIQYYVAQDYADNDTDAGNGIQCAARHRGFQYKGDEGNDSVQYQGGTGAGQAIYVYDGLEAVRKLWRIKTTWPTGATGGPLVDDGNLVTVVGDVTIANETLPTALLEVRFGPDVINGGVSETAPKSAQNVFVLIAPGENRNADHNRTYFRDSNHRGNSGGSSWSPDSSNNLDLVVFSSTPDVDATDEGSDGDDTLKYMSFRDFKAGLSRYGLNMEPVICAEPC